jgi:Mg2+-importing ATPase
MIAVPITCAVIGAILPFTPLAKVLGFTSLPIAFFLILLGMIGAYLVLVEAVKARFYAFQERPDKEPSSPRARHHRHVRRRAARFVRPHGAAG